MNNQVPSPASSLASDTDAYNTADARIHFGPLRSPEKRFHSIVACSDLLYPSPFRSSPQRSPRISNPCSLSPYVTVGESSSTRYEHEHENVNEETERIEEVADPLHPETPEYEQLLQDEPPSVLATKIMRAHDNPSPPPDSPRLGFADPDCRFHIRSPCSPPTLSGNAMAVGHGLNLPLVDPSPLSPSLREVERVLLFFDSPLTTPTPSPSAGSPRASSPQPPVVTSRPSIDDLLSLSPGPVYPPECPVSPSSSSPCSSMPVDEQLKVDETTKEKQQATYGTTSLICDATVLSEGPSMGHQKLSPSLVPLGDDEGTDIQQDVTAHETAVKVHSATPCTEGAGSPPRTQKEQEEGTQKCLVLDDSANESGGKEGHITRRIARATRSASRELESLSPSSADLLARLLSSPESESVPGVARDNIRGVSAVVERTDSLPLAPPPSRFPQLSVTPTPNTPIRLTSPIRFSSPTRSRGQQSPTRSRMHPAALDDPQRTPARRIPIAKGYGSPQKEANLVGRVPVLNIPPMDSPARRVNVNEVPTPRQGSRFGSPTRDTSVKRLTADSQSSRMSSGKNKDTQRSHTTSDSSLKSRVAGSSSASAMSKPHPLPFPIMASRSTHSQPTLEPKSTKGDAADVKMNSPVKSDSPPMSSPARSSLKQTTSRIPRVIKPYARPAVRANRQDKSTSTITGLAKTRVTPKAFLKTGTSSDNAAPNSEPISTAPGKSASTSMLKRKRGVGKASPPSKSRPIVLLRQVPRAVPSSDALKVSNVSSGVIRESVQPIRRVQEVQSTQPMQQDSDSDALETPDVEVQDNTTTLKFPSRMMSPSPPEQPAQHATDPPTRRRTTRIRKPAQPTAVADVFTDPSPPQVRRRVNKAQSSGDGALTGMSAVAVKALTSLNTIRNQQYLAAKIETEVVRKPGARPESPAVKIKPTLQRKLEAKRKERKERADRRAKRNSGGIGESPSDVDRQSDTSDSSAADFDSDWDDQNSSPLRKRHKRGPGDEEDYETPLKPHDREEDKAEATYEKRRVKWDRGLFTTIYLDEVTVGARLPPKEDTAPKGCLATTAKTAPLDTLGNLTNADTPLTELVRESVVVKKFVYDNDLEPVQEVVVVRNTRLRSKKGKD